MLVEILSHDVQLAKARIRFTHEGGVLEGLYDLLLVVPDMQATLARTGQTFDAGMQESVIAELTNWVQRAVDRGTFSAQCKLPAAPQPA